MTARTPAERKAAHRKRGRQIAVVLSAGAYVALTALVATHGSQRAAIEAALSELHRPKHTRLNP